MAVKAIARTIPPDATSIRHDVTWRAADLREAASLSDVLDQGDVVVNLAYVSAAGEAENVRLIDNLVDACVCRRVARLVHCSTAVVAGAVRTRHVVESTTCEPRTPYERTKWALEQRVLDARSRGLDVGIVRPTAIVGPGGRNLLKLARSLQHGRPIVNYMRASLFGRRPMHLVPARTVAAALLHVAMMPTALNGNVYLVSSDDDPENNFQDVEALLSRALGLAPRKHAPLRLPERLLSLLLGLLGRSDTDMARRYDSAKLRATKFVPVDSVAAAVCEFGRTLSES